MNWLRNRWNHSRNGPRWNQRRRNNNKHQRRRNSRKNNLPKNARFGTRFISGKPSLTPLKRASFPAFRDLMASPIPRPPSIMTIGAPSVAPAFIKYPPSVGLNMMKNIKEQLGAEKIWLAHNHPSGNVTPSVAGTRSNVQFAHFVTLARFA